MTPGLISIFCALGTVLGLAVLIFGLARKSNSMKIGGILCFVICFSGLIWLLANFGERPDEGQYTEDTIRWRIAKWELKSETPEGKQVTKDLTVQWDGKIYLIINEDGARFGDRGKTFLNRGFTATDSTWSFLIGKSTEAPPLSGTYEYNEISENEAILTKRDNNETEVLWLRQLE